MTTTRGIPEVPLPLSKTIVDKDGKSHIISVLTPQHQRFFTDIREQLIQLRSNQAVPDPPSNLRVTPQAFANLIQFTRSSNADYTELVISSTPNLNDPSSTIVDIGTGAQYQDIVGNSNITRYYWIRARKNTGSSSLQVGPGSGTTLAAATGVTPPTPPPPGNLVAIDQTTGQQYAYTLTGPRRLTHV
jgi:hypothetical protein